jgi:hypothetical protein
MMIIGCHNELNISDWTFLPFLPYLPVITSFCRLLPLSWQKLVFAGKNPTLGHMTGCTEGADPVIY